MRILVAGASGVLGQPTVRELRQAGHDVVGLVRSDAGATLVANLGAEPIRADVLDGAAVTKAVAGVEAVANLIGVLPVGVSPDRNAWSAVDRAWRDGTQNLTAAASAADVKVFVHASLAMLYGDHGDAWVTEQTKLDSPDLVKAAADAERTVLQAVEAGLPGVVLRLGTIYSTEAWHSQLLISQARQHQLAVIGDGDAYWSLLHADDAARAIVRAIDDAEGGSIYNVADDRPLQMAELFDLIARLVGAPRPPRVPRLLARALVGADALTLLTTSARLSSQAIKQDLELDLAYPTPEDGFKAVLSLPVPEPPP
jgi:nucleoside-diphosphate-sugar epimerase